MSKLWNICGLRLLTKTEWADRGLWYTHTKDGSKQEHLFDISRVTKETNGETYRALQVLVWRWRLLVAIL